MNPSEYNRIIVKIKMFAKDKYEFANHIVDLFCKQQSLVFVSIWIIRLIWVFCVEGRKKWVINWYYSRYYKKHLRRLHPLFWRENYLFVLTYLAKNLRRRRAQQQRPNGQVVENLQLLGYVFQTRHSQKDFSPIEPQRICKYINYSLFYPQKLL